MDQREVTFHPAIHQTHAHIVDHLPANTRLLIATRPDPPIFLPRLRGRGLVTEGCTGDSTFSLDEAAVFLGQVMRLRPTAGETRMAATRHRALRCTTLRCSG